MDSMNNEWFIVKNIEELINSARALVFNNFGKQNDVNDDSITDILNTTMNEQDQAELDEILSYDESCLIVKGLLKKQFNKKSKKIRYVMTEEIFVSVIESLNDRMVSNILNGLVNKGIVESAYDDKANDFVFWIKDENKKEKRKTD